MGRFGNGYLHLLVIVIALFLGLNNISLYEKAYDVITNVIDSTPWLSGVKDAFAVLPGSQPKKEQGDACTCGGSVVDPTQWEQKAACQLDGVVPHCCCSYAAVERLNLNSMRSILQELVRTPFFRYFKTDLMCECPFWPDDGMCSLKDCSVCECEPDEVPKTFRAV